MIKQLADVLGDLYGAMKALGLSESVTALTQSDFGRTFAPNSSAGTDHAWGNQHLVVSGSVHGGTSYGIYPSLVLAGPTMSGRPAGSCIGVGFPRPRSISTRPRY